MIVEKQLMNAFLSRIRTGAVTIHYWDDTTITYGPGKPDLTVSFKSPKAVRAMLRNMTLGFGENFMDGVIEVDGPLDHIGKLVAENHSAFLPLIATKITHLPSRNTRNRQKDQIQHHYDLGNDFYKLWLDKSMTYSCAYFTSPKDTLEQAQEAKRSLLLRKLQLQKGQRLLDIGSGWGSLLIKAAQEYGVSGLGVTLSKEQYEHSTAEAKRLGLDKKIKFELANYQDLVERKAQYDRIISVGMFEHVGRGNQKRYFDVIQKLLADDGLSVLHTICVPREALVDPWIDKYIFPGGHLPSIKNITKSLASHDFNLIDFENLRIHYAMTLDEWWKRYENNREKVIKMYDERFYRMWRFWLASSSAGFRYGDLNLGQFVFTKGLNNNLPLTREHIYK
jgi:cyclopropane-fatty-acyl-phospholipid synthase